MNPEAGLESVSLQDVALSLGSPAFIFCLLIAILVLFYLRRNPSIISSTKQFLAATRWRLEDSVALAMLLVFLLFLTRAIISLLMMKGLLEQAQLIPLSVVLQTLLFHIPIIAIVLAKTRRMHGDIMQPLGIKTSTILKDMGKGVIAYLASMPAIAAASLASWILLQRLNVESEPQFAIEILLDPHAMWLKLYLVAMAVISAPIAEELLFRFVCFPSLAKNSSPRRAALLISLLFAVVHLNAYAFLPLFVMALALCGAYAWTRSMIVPITMHALFNAVNLIHIYALQNNPSVM